MYLYNLKYENYYDPKQSSLKQSSLKQSSLKQSSLKQYTFLGPGRIKVEKQPALKVDSKTLFFCDKNYSISMIEFSFGNINASLKYCKDNILIFIYIRYSV